MASYEGSQAERSYKTDFFDPRDIPAGASYGPEFYEYGPLPTVGRSRTNVIVDDNGAVASVFGKREDSGVGASYASEWAGDWQADSQKLIVQLKTAKKHVVEVNPEDKNKFMEQQRRLVQMARKRKSSQMSGINDELREMLDDHSYRHGESGPPNALGPKIRPKTFFETALKRSGEGDEFLHPIYFFTGREDSQAPRAWVRINDPGVIESVHNPNEQEWTFLDRFTGLVWRNVRSGKRFVAVVNVSAVVDEDNELATIVWIPENRVEMKMKKHVISFGSFYTHKVIKSLQQRLEQYNAHYIDAMLRSEADGGKGFTVYEVKAPEGTPARKTRMLEAPHSDVVIRSYELMDSSLLEEKIKEDNLRQNGIVPVIFNADRMMWKEGTSGHMWIYAIVSRDLVNDKSAKQPRGWLNLNDSVIYRMTDPSPAEVVYGCVYPGMRWINVTTQRIWVVENIDVDTRGSVELIPHHNLPPEFVGTIPDVIPKINAVKWKDITPRQSHWNRHWDRPISDVGLHTRQTLFMKELADQLLKDPELKESLMIRDREPHIKPLLEDANANVVWYDSTGGLYYGYSQISHNGDADWVRLNGGEFQSLLNPTAATSQHHRSLLMCAQQQMYYPGQIWYNVTNHTVWQFTGKTDIPAKDAPDSESYETSASDSGALSDHRNYASGWEQIGQTSWDIEQAGGNLLVFHHELRTEKQKRFMAKISYIQSIVAQEVEKIKFPPSPHFQLGPPVEEGGMEPAKTTVNRFDEVRGQILIDFLGGGDFLLSLRLATSDYQYQFNLLADIVKGRDELTAEHKAVILEFLQKLADQTRDGIEYSKTEIFKIIMPIYNQMCTLVVVEPARQPSKTMAEEIFSPDRQNVISQLGRLILKKNYAALIDYIRDIWRPVPKEALRGQEDFDTLNPPPALTMVAMIDEKHYDVKGFMLYFDINDPIIKDILALPERVISAFRKEKFDARPDDELVQAPPAEPIPDADVGASYGFEGVVKDTKYSREKVFFERPPYKEVDYVRRSSDFKAHPDDQDDLVTIMTSSFLQINLKLYDFVSTVEKSSQSPFILSTLTEKIAALERRNLATANKLGRREKNELNKLKNQKDSILRQMAEDTRRKRGGEGHEDDGDQENPNDDNNDDEVVYKIKKDKSGREVIVGPAKPPLHTYRNRFGMTIKSYLDLNMNISDSGAVKGPGVSAPSKTMERIVYDFMRTSLESYIMTEPPEGEPDLFPDRNYFHETVFYDTDKDGNLITDKIVDEETGDVKYVPRQKQYKSIRDFEEALVSRYQIVLFKEFLQTHRKLAGFWKSQKTPLIPYVIDDASVFNTHLNQFVDELTCQDLGKLVPTKNKDYISVCHQIDISQMFDGLTPEHQTLVKNNYYGMTLADPNRVHRKTRAPTKTDDDEHGYEAGHVWVETTSGSNKKISYLCVRSKAGKAVWETFVSLRPAFHYSVYAHLDAMMKIFRGWSSYFNEFETILDRYSSLRELAETTRNISLKDARGQKYDQLIHQSVKYLLTHPSRYSFVGISGRLIKVNVNEVLRNVVLGGRRMLTHRPYMRRDERLRLSKKLEKKGVVTLTPAELRAEAERGGSAKNMSSDDLAFSQLIRRKKYGCQVLQMIEEFTQQHMHYDYQLEAIAQVITDHAERLMVCDRDHPDSLEAFKDKWLGIIRPLLDKALACDDEKSIMMRKAPRAADSLPVYECMSVVDFVRKVISYDIDEFPFDLVYKTMQIYKDQLYDYVISVADDHDSKDEKAHEWFVHVGRWIRKEGEFIFTMLEMMSLSAKFNIPSPTTDDALGSAVDSESDDESTENSDDEDETTEESDWDRESRDDVSDEYSVGSVGSADSGASFDF